MVNGFTNLQADDDAEKMKRRERIEWNLNAKYRFENNLLLLIKRSITYVRVPFRSGM